ncbi:DUF4126 domain-containing protein [Ottowia testudinis]|uniref:DUF4126 domain-containing protein n=1 Tax=Ottowia testudinis TaxID=2816950 RepID=A0A975CHL3_9BURK|nr:DUF4126 domain-containing protein [Ottowia testudinis]QTD45927.1 DUF4126 domain-containing protein [Ottowia testudinis]
MQDIIQHIVQWLHGMGIHPNADTAAAVGHAVGQAGATVGGAVAPVVAKMDMPSLMALAAALGWASGFRLYAVVFLTGAMGYAGWIPLPTGLHILEHPAVMAASGFMLLVEFFADKVPWLDSVWDTLNSVIRIPGGALLAAGVFGADSGTMGLVAGLLGGSLAATSFATKATTRAAINTSPEPFSNWLASLFEDGLAVGVMWLATQYPVTFGIALAVMLVVSVLLLFMLFKFLKMVIGKLRAFFGSGKPIAGGA